jgi:hypothetical protein
MKTMNTFNTHTLTEQDETAMHKAKSAGIFWQWLLIAILSICSGSVLAWPSGGGGLQDDNSHDIVVAPSGNTYIVGSYQGLATFGVNTLSGQGLKDVMVVKLGPSGAVLWAANAGGISEEEGLSIAIDSSENIYITGYFFDQAVFGGTTLTSAGGADIFVAKLNHQGSWQWARKAGGTGDDRGAEIGVTDGDNSTLPPTPGSVFVAGSYQCSANFGAADGGTPLSSGNCFTGEHDLFVARLDATGDWIWVRDRGVDASGQEAIKALAVENITGRLYLAGEYAQGGNQLLIDDHMDGVGNILGGFAGAPANSTAINNAWNSQPSFLTRHSAATITSGIFDTSGVGSIRVGYKVRRGFDFRIAVSSVDNLGADPSDNDTECWVDHTYTEYTFPVTWETRYVWHCEDVLSEDPDSGEDLFVEYLSGDGTTWVELERFAGNGTAGQIYDRSGTGRLVLPADAIHSGFRLRFRQQSGSGTYYDFWHVDDVTLETTGIKSSFVARLSNTLTDPAAPSFDVFLNLPGNLSPNDLTLNGNSGVNHLNLVGTSTGVVSYGSCGAVSTSGAFVAGLDYNNLDCIWAKGVDGGTGRGIASDDQGNVYITGEFNGTLTTPVGSIDATMPQPGSDIFVVKFAKDLNSDSWNWDWVTGGDYYDSTGIPGRAGSSANDTASAIASDSSGNLYVTGSFGDVAFFGNDENIVPNGGSDIYVANLGDDGRWFEIESWTVGQAVPPPPGAEVDSVILQPQIYIDGNQVLPGQGYEDLFYWAPPVGGQSARLVPLQPMPSVEIRWYATTDVTNPARVVSLGATSWPAYACTDTTDTACYQIHIAGAPVEVEPADGGYTFLVAKTPAVGGSDVMVSAGQLSANQVGFAVLIYAGGPSPDPTAYPAAFEVVRTMRYDSAPAYSRGVPWEIGQKIIEPTHNEPGRTGYVLNANSFYDGTGPDAAYDRAGRTGLIIPVNRFEPTRAQDAGKELVVAWYRKNVKNVYWPVKPIQYEPFWPLDPDRIIVASELGGEVLGQDPLDPLVYQSASIYQQPNALVAGFNPNDEHAIMAPSNTGTGFSAVFALRSDFGSELPGDSTAASDPYVLIKYFEPVSSEWAFRVYKVMATGAGYDGFRYTGVAGTTVSPPYPLRLFPSCVESSVVGQAASDPQPPPPFFQDYSGLLWAKSASRPQDAGDVLYHYPLQAGFYYDVDNDGVVENTDGECIPWLARLPADQGGSASPTNPIKVHYDIVWPADVPQLVIGETLLEPKRGLPDILNQAAVEVVFDEYQENQAQPEPSDTLAQLIDPLNPRSVILSAIPAAVATELGEAGKKVILGTADGVVKIPVSLRNRLSYDPINKKLILKGVYDPTSAGEPLLLLNVLSKLDRVLLKQLDDNSDGSEQSNYTGKCVSTAEACSWDQAIEALFRISRNPQDIMLVCTQSSIDENNNRSCDLSRSVNEDDVLVGLQDSNGDGVLEPFQAAGVQAALTAGSARGTGYMTLAFNNNASLAPLPVSLNIIRVDFLQSPPPPTPPVDADVCSTYQGQLQIITPENIFDEQLVLRHSGDFGGRSDELEYEWYFHPDTDGTPPSVLPDPDNGQLNGWQKFAISDPLGAVEISIEGANIQTLSDNWFIARYRGLPSCIDRDQPGATDWSLWAGQPGATPLDQRAQLAEGWVKRVLKRLNPFEARVQDFAKAATNNYASMLVQLGERYEGDVALNNDPANINGMGLIEAYETIMRRAINLSISSTPPVNYEPANNAILLVASRLADFYMLLGNEAYADAQDPTVGITTTNNGFGFDSLAPTIFSFQNQLASVLEEELTLLRGRDDSLGPVAANPVYNRLFWNFTTGDGEVAYATGYAITDQNADGIVDEFDARILFPQGHGDAWGHYLTAINYYYKLLRHPFYTWNPRAEAITVAGTPISVDFQDERTFAEIAAAKARAGAEIVDLTYRNSYVDDPAGQWQGYKDTDSDRAWGLSEWGSRAGQGAYFDWVVGNAILQAEDPDPGHVGIQKVDRTTVEELKEIVASYLDIQAQVDEADKGLNPLGLAKGMVAFDIDPSKIDAGETHFEQIYARAQTAMENVVKVWDFANTLNRMLRLNQKSVDDLRRDSTASETDFKNRLIEIFGYPYDDDIGVGGLYPAGYDGPDLYHYMMVDVPALAGTAFDVNGTDPLLPGSIRKFSSSYKPSASGMDYFTIVGEEPDLDCGGNPLGDGCSLGKPTLGSLPVENFSLETDLTGFMLTKDPSWTGNRRAPGELQNILADMAQAKIDLQRVAREYDNLTRDITDQIDTIQATFDIRDEQISISNDVRKELTQLRITTEVFKNAAIVARRAGNIIEDGFKTAEECVPDELVVGFSNGGDVFAGISCALEGGAVAAKSIGDAIGDGLDIVANATSAAAEDVPAQGAIESQIQDARLELFNLKGDLDKMLRQEPLLRSDIYTKAEVITGLQGKFYATLARGQRALQQLITFRKTGAAAVQEYRYEDMAFRIFRNDALQKYRAAFDLAARYTYMAATAYDYETNLLGSDAQSGQDFLTQIVRERSVGQILDGSPVPGSPGLADPMARMDLNFQVLKGQMGFNNPQTETNRFSLREEMMRINGDTSSDEQWRNILEENRVDNLWDIPEFRRYARPFAPESAGAQPGIVIRFPTTVNFGLNFFGWQLGPGDSAYDSSRFATKVRGVGVWLKDYANLPLSNTPRVYLIPIGADVLRSPAADNFQVREWSVVDQVIPVPFPVGSQDLEDVNWLPSTDTLIGSSTAIRQYASFRAHHFTEPFDATEIVTDSRLIGRSVWNREWMLVIPGGTFLFDANEGLDTLIHGELIPGGNGERDGNGIKDISLFFNTYSYSGI